MQRDSNPVDQDVLDCLDIALRDRSARVDLRSLTGSLKALIVEFGRRADNAVRVVNAGIPPYQRCSPFIFFCEAVGYGAYALHCKYDYIVLHIGLVPTLTDFFQRMMATAGLWPSVGEQKGCQVAERSAAANSFPAHVLWNVLPQRAPDDPLRNALAVVFMGECFALIVRHELAHLALKHLDADTRQIVRGDPIARQALELAADGHAAIWGLHWLRRIPAALEGHVSVVADAHREFYRTPDDALTNYLLAMFFVFRLMDETSWNNDTLGAGHPPAPIRFHTACIHLIDHFKQVGDADNGARVRRAMKEIWELGEVIFASTLGRKPNSEIKRLTLSEISEQHYNQISDRARALPQHLFGLMT